MLKLTVAVVIAGMLSMAQTADLNRPVDLGQCRITCYCPTCNDGEGHESSSGTYLEYGHAACRWLPIGTVIDIEGDEFEIVDTCGTDAIDIFIDDESGCRCNLNEYRHVVIRKEAKQ